MFLGLAGFSPGRAFFSSLWGKFAMAVSILQMKVVGTPMSMWRELGGRIICSELLSMAIAQERVFFHR